MMDYTAMAEQLTGEYRTVFEKVELYSDMNGVPEEIKADRLMNLLDLLTTAEAEQKPAAEIIGANIRIFCKEYFSDYNLRSKISEIPQKIYNIMRPLLLILLLDIFFLDHPTKNLLYMKSDILPVISGLLMGSLLAILLKYVIGPMIYRSKRIPSIVYYFLIILLFIVAVIISMYIIQNKYLQLPTFPFLVVSVSYIFFYLIVRSVIRYRKTGSIRKPKAGDPEYEFHLTKSGSNSKDVENAAQKSLVKRYQRINKKRTRRNQAAMTTPEFIQKVRREDAIIYPICIWGLGIFYIFIAVGSMVDEIYTFGFSINSFFLLAILSAIYIPLFLFLRSCMRQGAKCRADILAVWESQGITILEKNHQDPSDSPDNLQN